jgi:hypothetical protein
VELMGPREGRRGWRLLSGGETLCRVAREGEVKMMLDRDEVEVEKVLGRVYSY